MGELHKKFSLIGAIVLGTVVLSAFPISVEWSAGKNLSVSQDKASVAGVHRRL
jgi:hypothetical protein